MSDITFENIKEWETKLREIEAALRERMFHKENDPAYKLFDDEYSETLKRNASVDYDIFKENVRKQLSKQYLDIRQKLGDDDGFQKVKEKFQEIPESHIRTIYDELNKLIKTPPSKPWFKRPKAMEQFEQSTKTYNENMEKSNRVSNILYQIDRIKKSINKLDSVYSILLPTVNEETSNTDELANQVDEGNNTEESSNEVRSGEITAGKRKTRNNRKKSRKSKKSKKSRKSNHKK